MSRVTIVAADMTDESVREIQVSRKQLVFLFMASVVIAVAVFLLGVSVGRGVRGGATSGGANEVAASPAQAEPVAPGDMPPRTIVEPRDLKFQQGVQGSATAVAGAAAVVAADPAKGSEAAGDVPEVDETPGKPPEKPAPAPPTTLVVAPKPAPTPAAKSAEAAPPSGSAWFLQVDSFRSRENADKEVARLKAKSFPAQVVPSQSGALFRVRVGPYAARADADRAVVRLRSEGLNPSVTR